MLNDQIASIYAGSNEPRYSNGNVKIVPNEFGLEVNGKKVLEDMEGNWQCNGRILINLK